MMKNRIEKINNLLNENNIEYVWGNIIKTHSYFYSKKNPQTEDFALNEKKYEDNIILEEDLLDSLSIGEIGVLYEYSQAYVDVDARKEKGQFFTPDDTAFFMATKAKEFKKGVWLDPCSGVGNLSYTLAKSQIDSEDFVANYLILQDIDPLALSIAHGLFALHFQKTIPQFYEKIRKNFRLQNFLIQTEFDHDYVIVNPPYLKVSENKQFEASKCCDLYGYFLENILKNSKGYISITPQSYTNSAKFKTLRNIITKQVEQLDIYAFDNVPDMIFKGVKYGSKNSNKVNSVRASIMVGSIGSNNKNFRITPLLRWATKQRPLLFENVDNQLGDFEPKINSIYPKIGKNFTDLYNTVKDNKTFSEILSQKPTEYKLYVPSTPRYYITASYKELNRSSYHTLYFNNESDLKTGYLLINSSFAYWWWRVVDGGMTLSQTTLKTMPLPKFEINEILIEKLVAEESTNLVVKVNSGRINENIKHDSELVRTVTSHIFDNDNDIVEALTNTHSNTFIIE